MVKHTFLCFLNNFMLHYKVAYIVSAMSISHHSVYPWEPLEDLTKHHMVVNYVVEHPHHLNSHYAHAPQLSHVHHHLPHHHHRPPPPHHHQYYPHRHQWNYHHLQHLVLSDLLITITSTLELSLRQSLELLLFLLLLLVVVAEFFFRTKKYHYVSS
ncbi:hypothetical protein FF38_08799 [Lucilia cuprina]|uniref:Uncharacterized protein n=1 Tax=Lucilia cuprina TaxID=7375 RepID=A0A0L0BUL9_LUCCU|nr:hypothetical protein FF38_08799 [Lucilia cuprina]